MDSLHWKKRTTPHRYILCHLYIHITNHLINSTHIHRLYAIKYKLGFWVRFFSTMYKWYRLACNLVSTTSTNSARWVLLGAAYEKSSISLNNQANDDMHFKMIHIHRYTHTHQHWMAHIKPEVFFSRYISFFFFFFFLTHSEFNLFFTSFLYVSFPQ